MAEPGFAIIHECSNATNNFPGIVLQEPAGALAMGMIVVAGGVKYRFDIVLERTNPMGISRIYGMRKVKK
jgi:hypothetical protein